MREIQTNDVQPAPIMRFNVSASLDDGPIVAMIFVAL
jgi:hypothetical protein